jgi:radical SAM superfamily enzyme with C-terminal helix-hairpin-helix motif
MLSYCILDCYVDEPACFGVPPFVSPYPRYIYGALIDAGVPESAIEYLTIDALREQEYRLDKAYSMVFLIGGAVVPGKYLGSKIGSASEIRRIAEYNDRQNFGVGGLISRVLRAEHNVTLVYNDIEKFAHQYARNEPEDAPRSTGEIARWAAAGAAVVRRHPRFPDIICEVETSRGCPRESHCSFCSEGLFGKVEFRDAEDIIREVDALISAGVSRFRLGRQADILQYKSDCTSFKNGFPVPAVAPIVELLSHVRERRKRGLITVLNIDNANPGTIANFPDESSRILEALALTVTPGDTIALGVESFDDDVVRQNNLKVTADQAIFAVDIINQIGGTRVESIPVILPGINLIHGLAGETMKTFEINYRRLMQIQERGLLVKRINIRQVLPFPGTPIYGRKISIPSRVENRFRYYRDRIRSDIENPMLCAIYPPGTILRASQVLETKAGYSYGKQIASYSITAKFPLLLPKMSFLDAVIVGHRERSVIALPFPVDLNSLPQKAIELVPGIGKRKSADIVLNRPFRSKEEIHTVLEGVNKNILDKIIQFIPYR